MLTQIGGNVDQDLPRANQRALQSVGAVQRDRALGKGLVHVAAQLGKHLSERQIGIGLAGQVIALAEGGEQLGMRLLGTARELPQQRRLPGARLADDERQLATTRQRQVEQPASRMFELTFSANKGADMPDHVPLHGSRPSHRACQPRVG